MKRQEKASEKHQAATPKRGHANKDIVEKCKKVYGKANLHFECRESDFLQYLQSFGWHHRACDAMVECEITPWKNVVENNVRFVLLASQPFTLEECISNVVFN